MHLFRIPSPAFRSAAKQGNFGLLLDLLLEHVDVNACEEAPLLHTALHLAARHGHPEVGE